MSVLDSHVLKNVNQFSPVCEEFERVVKFGENGEELVTYEPFDLSKVRLSLGSVDQWSLKSLMKAGINPDMSIRTGFNSRLEGVDTVNAFADGVDAIVASDVSTITESVE